MKKYTKYIYIILVGLAISVLSGCQNDSDIEKYNELSKQHQETIQEAFTELNNSISYYNNKEYDKAKTSADICQTLFTETEKISVQAKEIAQKINNREWLVEYKDYSIQAEKLRQEQCQYLSEVSITTKNKENESSQELINKISEINDKYNKIQTTMEDIKSQHPESFNQK